MADVFIPQFASRKTASPSGSTTSVALEPTCPQVRLNWVATTPGTQCQVIWGKGAQTALTTHMDLNDGAIEVFGKQDADTLAVIGTGTLKVICGTGA